MHVDLHIALRIGGDAGGLQAQIVGVGLPPEGQQHVAGHDLRRALRALQLHGRTVGMRREGDAARVGAYRDALVLQHLGDGLGDVGILAPDQVRVLLHHRDLRPQAAKDLRKFQADVAAADHHQMLRQRAQLQDRVLFNGLI